MCSTKLHGFGAIPIYLSTLTKNNHFVKSRYIYVCTHKHTHTRTHTYIHTRIHTYVHRLLKGCLLPQRGITPWYAKTGTCAQFLPWCSRFFP